METRGRALFKRSLGVPYLSNGTESVVRDLLRSMDAHETTAVHLEC